MNSVCYVSIENIFCLQDARNPLWMSCIFKKKTFSEVCSENNNDINKLIQKGLNANFFTADRWLDPQVIEYQLSMSISDLVQKLKISRLQISTWPLWIQELTTPSTTHLPIL